MGDVAVRRAEPDDALIVGALHVQLARELGMPSEAGYLDRFAGAWLAQRDDRPTWIAERAGEHAGILESLPVRALPLPGRATVTWLLVGTVYVVPDQRRNGVGRALVGSAVDWARASGARWVRAGAEGDARRFYEGVGFVVPATLAELDLRSDG